MIYTSNYDTVLKYPELADRLVSIAQHTHSAFELAKELDNKILLCYEPKGEFCHRHIVAQWFKEHGVMCSEWEVGCEEDQCENL